MKRGILSWTTSHNFASNWARTTRRKAFQARRGLWLLISAAGAPGKESDRAVLAAGLAGELSPRMIDKDKVEKNRRSRSRNQIAIALADIAGDPEIPALVEALYDFDVRECARFALARTPSAAATAALAETAQKAVGVEYRVGAIGSLGHRAGDIAVDALKQVRDDTGIEVRLAAAESLAEQPDASGDAIIARSAKTSAPPALARPSARSIARLQLAQHACQSGSKGRRPRHLPIDRVRRRRRRTKERSQISPNATRLNTAQKAIP